jgi:tetratricopeptide (TPR) repeat protein
LNLAPDNATARYWYAMFVLLPTARFDEALGQARWAADLDPVNPGICAATGLIYYMQGQRERALEELDAALDLEPTHPLSNIIAAYAYNASGRPQEALSRLEHCQSMRVVATGARAWAMIVSGREDKARALLEELLQMSRQGNTQADFEMARVHVGLGEVGPALDCLESTYEQRSGALYWLNVNHYFDPLRSSPRFAELLKKLRLST